MIASVEILYVNLFSVCTNGVVNKTRLQEAIIASNTTSQINFSKKDIDDFSVKYGALIRACAKKWRELNDNRDKLEVLLKKDLMILVIIIIT